jgi:VWFA-related protein
MLLSRPIMKGALIFALLLTAPAFSREDTPLRPVRITATVIDRLGKPLTGLTLKDFSLLDQGVAQPLQSVEARKPGPRRLAILLDEFHVDPADTDRVRAALIAFADQQLRPDDMVVVLKPLDSLPSIRLSNDRDAIKKAIADFAGRQGIYVPRTPLEEEAIGRAPALAERARAQVVLSALRELASRLGSVTGRSAILIVSSGFRQSPAAVPARTLPDAGIVERFANRYDVPVYGFDPGAPAEASADDSQVLASLAAQTGGTFTSAPDLDAALRQVARELDSGYLLTFNPSGKDDGKFHAVTVRTSRRGAQVRARAGYVSPPPPESRSASRSTVPMLDTSRPLRRSPLIQVWSGVTRASDTQARVVVTWEPGRSLGGAVRSNAARVTLKATTKDGAVLFDGTLDQVHGIGEAMGSSDRAEFDAPTGPVQLDMAILGERGDQLDTDARDFDVPNLKPQRTLLLPPQMLATRSAREFREATNELDASPEPSREFRRTERLLIRVPALSASVEPPRVSAELLNRSGQKMWDLVAVPGDAGTGVSQFDLPLAPLAPGDYIIQFTATGESEPVQQRVNFKVTG